MSEQGNLFPTEVKDIQISKDEKSKQSSHENNVKIEILPDNSEKNENMGVDQNKDTPIETNSSKNVSPGTTENKKNLNSNSQNCNSNSEVSSENLQLPPCQDFPDEREISDGEKMEDIPCPSKNLNNQNLQSNNHNQQSKTNNENFNRSQQTNSRYPSNKNQIKTNQIKNGKTHDTTSHIKYSNPEKYVSPEIKNNPYVLKKLNQFQPKTSTIPRAAARSSSVFHPLPAIDELTNQFLNGETPDSSTPQNEIKESMLKLKKIKTFYLEQGDYINAEKAEKARERAFKAFSKNESKQKDKASIEQLLIKRNELILLTETIKQDWNQIMNEENERTSETIGRMRRKNEEELAAFDSNIPEDLPPLFKKNSKEYHQMRSKEKHLAKNNKFSEARALQKKADQLETEENERNFEQMNSYYRQKRRCITRKQQRDINYYLDNAQIRLYQMDKSKNKAIEGQLKRIERLNIQIEKRCEKTGIKQSELDLAKIDEKHLEKVKKEQEAFNSFPRRRPKTTMSQSPKKPDTNYSSSRPYSSQKEIFENTDQKTESHFDEDFSSSNKNEIEKNEQIQETIIVQD